MKFFAVLEEDKLSNGEKVDLKVNQHSILLVKHKGSFYAYKNQCAHLKFPLTHAAIEDDVLACNVHGWLYDIKNGRGINPTGVALCAYPVKITDGKIHIGVDE